MNRDVLSTREELPDCSCGNSYLAIRTDIYKDKREFIYCDCCGAMATRDLWCAAPAVTAAPAERVPLNDEQIAILQFLRGARAFDGVWFSEKHPTKRGNFWWRLELDRLFGINGGKEVANG